MGISGRRRGLHRGRRTTNTIEIMDHLRKTKIRRQGPKEDRLVASSRFITLGVFFRVPGEFLYRWRWRASQLRVCHFVNYCSYKLSQHITTETHTGPTNHVPRRRITSQTRGLSSLYERVRFYSHWAGGRDKTTRVRVRLQSQRLAGSTIPIQQPVAE